MIDFGAIGDGETDDSAVINRALVSGKTVLDGFGRNYKINSPVIIPAGVTLQNANFILGTPGMDGVLVNTRSKVLRVKITGSGTVNIVERGIYPAANGVIDVELDVEVTNMTVGVHAQPLSGLIADAPQRWRGYVFAHDIVGSSGASEGYGLLLSPALDCDFYVVAKEIPRHAVYLSAGAKYNFIKANVERIGSHAIALYSTGAQPETSFNSIRLKFKNLYEYSASAGSGAFVIAQKANYNTIIADGDLGANLVREAGLIEGASAEPYPTGNSIVDGSYVGVVNGVDILRNQNTDGSIISRNRIKGSASYAAISLRYSGVHTGVKHGGEITDNSIDLEGSEILKVYTEVQFPCVIRDNY